MAFYGEANTLSEANFLKDGGEQRRRGCPFLISGEFSDRRPDRLMGANLDSVNVS